MNLPKPLVPGLQLSMVFSGDIPACVQEVSWSLAAMQYDSDYRKPSILKQVLRGKDR